MLSLWMWQCWALDVTVYWAKDLFICLWIFVPLENFSLIWRRHHCRWRDSNFDLCLALMTIEQWGFFSVPHLLRHVASVYNGHLWEPITLTPTAECLAIELSLSAFTTGLLQLGFTHPIFSLGGKRSHPLRYHRVWAIDVDILYLYVTGIPGTGT